jgi:hypothetical protein
MSIPAAYALENPPPVARHDRVRVPDGRVGRVIGFYRRAVESVLVSFGPGDAEEFLLPDVRRP